MLLPLPHVERVIFHGRYIPDVVSSTGWYSLYLCRRVGRVQFAWSIHVRRTYIRSSTSLLGLDGSSVLRAYDTQELHNLQQRYILLISEELDDLLYDRQIDHDLSDEIVYD